MERLLARLNPLIMIMVELLSLEKFESNLNTTIKWERGETKCSCLPSSTMYLNVLIIPHLTIEGFLLVREAKSRFFEQNSQIVSHVTNRAALRIKAFKPARSASSLEI